MICAGIDAGSRTLKVVLLDADRLDVVAAGVMDQGIDQEALAQQLMDRLLEEQGITRRDVRAIVATGYGRKLIHQADETITEITCQGRGVRQLAPQARTIIDIGGQDSKLIRLDAHGTVEDFVMNDRCAAGTGRFLEVVAARLGVKLGAFDALIGRGQSVASISSMCVVFAETEVVGLLASGVPPEAIAAGVQASLAARVAAMAGRKTAGPVVFTGGVALVAGMVRALESALGQPITIASDPQLTAALGAAILAARRFETNG
jgi:predicted CoA-substrate-specific enzyme activase